MESPSRTNPSLLTCHSLGICNPTQKNTFIERELRAGGGSSRLMRAGGGCINVLWPPIPGAYHHGDATGGDWLGSLIPGIQDASGLLYRRNRYYDPQTGQFTQAAFRRKPGVLTCTRRLLFALSSTAHTMPSTYARLWRCSMVPAQGKCSCRWTRRFRHGSMGGLTAIWIGWCWRRGSREALSFPSSRSSRCTSTCASPRMRRAGKPVPTELWIGESSRARDDAHPVTHRGGDILHARTSHESISRFACNAPE